VIARLEQLACRLGGHHWTKAFSVQLPDHRVVSRYCTRCDATSHVVQDVWSEPHREFNRAAQSWLDGARGGAA
jgi:hypothetical protein